MDDPDITMEEYIQLEAEKGNRRGKEFNWKTATYGKVREGIRVVNANVTEGDAQSNIIRDVASLLRKHGVATSLNTTTGPNETVLKKALHADDVIPSKDTPIDQSVSINPKPVSYAGAITPRVL
ncbi:hypothetical protein Tco_0905970, partial [Tanacetum coccineum]